jgi:hypothetical protein
MDKTADFLMVVADKKVTHFMQCADVWDSGRVVAEAVEVTATFDDDVELTLERAFKMFNEKLPNDENMEIVYAELLRVQVGNVITLNDRVVPFFKEGINSISDGNRFFMFSDFVKSRGFDVERGNTAAVTSISFKEKEEAK